MNLKTNADYAHEADRLLAAVWALEDELEQAIAWKYEGLSQYDKAQVDLSDSVRVTNARKALDRAKWSALQFQKKHWDKIKASRPAI